MDAMRFGLKQFAAAERGTVAVIAAFGLVPAIAALGLSVDLGRTFVAKNALARAADAAAVAGARSFTEDGVVADVHRYFDANYEPSKLGTDQPVVSPHFDPLTGRITVTATARLQTTFMKVAMIDSLDIEARAVAQVFQPGLAQEIILPATFVRQPRPFCRHRAC